MAWVAIVLICLFHAQSVWGQLYDGLDAYPTRWQLDQSDCDARIIKHIHLADGGLDGRACEAVTLSCGHGTQAILLYRIEPVQPLDDLTANVSVFSSKTGYRVGFRVRFPYLRDASDRRALATFVFGTEYTRPAEYAPIGIGAITRELNLKKAALRQEHGTDADLRDPYVDAVVINAYSGAGKNSIRLDELHVDGMVPVGLEKESAESSRSLAMRRGDGADFIPKAAVPAGSDLRVEEAAFTPGQVVRILQHNREPLAWVRSLGFDAVLLAQPPTAELLREAIQARVMVYAPPPTAPDPAIQSLLEPIAGWYLGAGQTLDTSRINDTKTTSQRVRKWPRVWQRPIIAAPLESRRQYEPLVDAMVHDLPPPIRSLTGDEESLVLQNWKIQRTNRVEFAIGISSMPSESLIRQVDSIAESIGAPRDHYFDWHAMWLQTMRSLQCSPRAIVFRSTRSLATGDPLDSRRASALSYVNRMVAMLSPWIASAVPKPPISIEGAPYQVACLGIDQTDLYIFTSGVTRGSQVLAGDGNTIELQLPPGDASKLIWRLTHFSTERVPTQPAGDGTRVQIISPDVVEILFATRDPALASQLTVASNRYRRQAAIERWQLTEESIRHTSEDWNLASAARVLPANSASNLIAIASETMAETEPLFRAGDLESSLRMARRADAWCLRSRWQLTELLMPDWPIPTSCPPALVGNMPAQIAWLPVLGDQGWGTNRLSTGSLDDPRTLADGRWGFGRRLQSRATSEVRLDSRDAVSGLALQARVTPLVDEQLPGGYEGTVIQITSPGIRVPAGKAVRIEAMVRTLGFGGPHQGLLVYDSIGNQELGLLVRGQTRWTPVRLYRQTTTETEVKVMFELIGAGEATIDDVQLRLWEPQPRPETNLRPIDSSP